MPKQKQGLRRYIIMSSEGYQGPSLATADFKPSAHMVAVAPRPEAVTAPQMRVLDSLHDSGRAFQLAAARTNVIFEMGQLAHFVGDGSQPLALMQQAGLL